MRFAFLIMGKFDSREDQAVIHNGTARIIGVSDLEDAARTAKRLEEEGIDCIELCGAFREEGARAVIEATGNRIPVGYVTHLPEQDDVYRKAGSPLFLNGPVLYTGFWLTIETAGVIFFNELLDLVCG